MRKATALFLVLAYAVPLRADSLSLRVFGKSIHTGQCKVECSEENPGLGLDLTRGDIFFNAGAIRNSFSKNSFYMGVGRYVQFGDSFWLRLSGWGGLIYYPSPIRKESLWPGFLPAVSIGTKQISLTGTYIPDIKNYVIPAWVFNLNFVIKEAP